MDKLFRVDVLAKTPEPQTLVYAALHQDYSEDLVMRHNIIPNEPGCGKIAVDRLLKGDRGHFGCLEHPAISFSCGYFPHSVMQQARTHRIGVSFDVQSGRYTGQRVIRVAQGQEDVEKVFYLRPPGDYTDRQGKRYSYTKTDRDIDLSRCLSACVNYMEALDRGLSEEHARGMLPFDIRQHFVVSFNLRSLMHFLDLRGKRDAQLEIQQLCELIYPHFEQWAPEIANWYTQARKGKAKLAP